MACSKKGATGNDAVKCVPCEGGESSGLKIYDNSELQKASLLFVEWMTMLSICR